MRTFLLIRHGHQASSVGVLALNDGEARLLRLNDTGGLSTF